MLNAGRISLWNTLHTIANDGMGRYMLLEFFLEFHININPSWYILMIH